MKKEKESKRNKVSKEEDKTFNFNCKNLLYLAGCRIDLCFSRGQREGKIIKNGTY